MQFLIDECLSPLLVDVANERGFHAYHVAHRGWSGLKDAHLLDRLQREQLILVTNNREDFLGIMQGTELHPGLVVIMKNVRRDRQVELFGCGLAVIAAMDSMINKVVEVDVDGSINTYDLPRLD